MILGIHIQNFEALYDVCIGLKRADLMASEGQYRVLREITAIVGANNVGKSSIFRSLTFLQNGLNRGFSAAATEGMNIGFSQLLSRHSSGVMHFDLICYAHRLRKILLYKLEINPDKHGRPRISYEQVQGLDVSEKQASTLLHEDMFIADGSAEIQTFLDLRYGQGEVLSGGVLATTKMTDRKTPALQVYGNLLEYEEISWLYTYINSWYFCHLSDLGDTQMLQQREKHRSQLAGGFGEHHHINPDGSNVENFMAYLKSNNPDYYRSIISDLEKRLPHARDIYKRIRQGSASGSEFKLFILFLILLDPEPRTVIFIENPDHGLYYNMIDELAAAMRAYVLREDWTQIMFSTHSQNLVESLTPAELWVLYRADEVGHGSQILNADDIPLVSEMYAEGVGLSSLWYAGHLDPVQSSDEDETDDW